MNVKFVERVGTGYFIFNIVGGGKPNETNKARAEMEVRQTQ